GLGVHASWKRRGGTKRRRQATNTEASEPRAGPLKALANACVDQVKELIKTGQPIGFVFDNINFMIKVAEPILGKIADSAMNSTCATVFQLFGATSEALDQEKAHAAFLNAPPLEPKDILLSEEETNLHTRLMVHSVLKIILTHAGDYLSRYMPLLEASLPATDHLIPLHQSQTHLLPAMEIDESLVDGTIQVMEAIYATLDIDTKSESFQKQVQFVSRDLKSILNLDAAKKARAGHDDPAYSFWNITFIIGLFHMLMAAVAGFLILHFGQPNAAGNNTGSLYYHNRIVEQNPISINSPIPYTLAKNLINISLAARVIHCLTLESGCRTLDEYIKLLGDLDSQAAAQGEKQDTEQYIRWSWERLVTDATKVYEKYTNMLTVEELRMARKFAQPNQPPAGDMVYENALLFMRDMLNVHAIRWAVKRGDPGCVLIVLKIFALSFRGAGQKHYAQEILRIIHSVEKVWPIPLRDFVLKNWMLNTTGHKESWIGIDHHQEHDNLWIKTIYKARGSNAAWSWIAAISPCVEALRALARDLNKMLGRHVGTKHTSPDLSTDIATLISDLEDKQVYQIKVGRDFGNKDEPVPDVEDIGLSSLFDDSPSALDEYNHSFQITQRAYRRPVVSAMVSHPSQAGPQVNQDQREIDSAASQQTGDTNIDSESESSESRSDDEGEGLEAEQADDASEEELDTQLALANIGAEDDDLADMFFDSIEDQLIEGDGEEQNKGKDSYTDHAYPADD
ncbi:hypothetical protein FRC07_003872, partial [Ceratobasidium sp. 392]